LEDDFIEALKPLIHDYKKIAENRRKRTEQGNKKIDDAKKEDDQAGQQERRQRNQFTIQCYSAIRKCVSFGSSE
jgi:hypothetical protein